MLYLLIAIVCAALFSIIFKVCQEYGIDSRLVILFNYLLGMCISLIPVISGCIESGHPEYFILPALPVSLAFIQGILYVTGFVLMDISVWRSGVALSNAAAKASLISPVILSWLLLGQPAPSWIGVILILISLALIILPNKPQEHNPSLRRSPTDEIRKKKSEIYLAAVFLCYGVSDFVLKLTQHSVEGGINEAIVECRTTSLTAGIFLGASIFMLAICLFGGNFKKGKIGYKTIGFGMLLGLANVSCTWCSLKALTKITTGVFFPVYNIGIVILSTFVGIFIFREKIRKPQILGLVLAAVAIFLIQK